MLSSSAKHPPPPPPQQEKLKSDGDDDEAVVDLLKCSDDNSHTHPNKFSIRDYVFAARGKDIKSHWPFSPENLQLCMRNGVTEVLPPFETIETLKAVVKRLDEHTSCLTSGPDSSKNAGLELALGDKIENFNSNSPEQEEDEEYMPDVNPVPFQTKSSFPKARKPATTFRASGKANAKNQGKKCRLIVKLGNCDISDPTSNEWDFSEAHMASSKVCPVCKTFMSSSNTTLNAHIDQCLCGESKVERTENPKEVIVKHRIIKPRKVRLMVDIYKTALGCTLEDLDKRNGTNFASNLSFPALDQENVDNNSIISEDKNEGAVYIDSSGTKVCILSKLSNMNPNTNGEDDCGPRKLLERDKVSQILPSNKKKHLVQRKNILKWPPYERRCCSPGPGRSPEKMKFRPLENEKDGSVQPLKAACHECEHDQLKSNGSGLINQRIGSERTTGHKMKINPDQKSRNPDKIITLKNSRIKSGQLPSLDDYKLIKRTRDWRLPISTSVNTHPKPISASDSLKRKESVEQQPCLTNRAGYSLFDSQDFDYGKKTKNNHMTLLHKRNFKRRKENRTSFPNGKEVERLSPSSKSSMPIRHASFSDSKKFKKSSTIHIQNNTVDTRMGKDSDHSSFDHRARALKMRKSRRGLLNRTSPNHSNSSSESHSHGFEHNIDSFVSDNGGMSGSLNADETRDEFVSELISKISGGGEPRISYDESLAYEEKMLCATKDLVAEVNNNEVEEGNYFTDVDPIPIPSPPGSFLPSPGHMGSEELQGNSTLTSCRVHSSGNEPDWIYRRDPSDSPISGPSFVSNSVAFRSHAVIPPVVEISNPNGLSMDSPNARSVFAESRFPIGGDCESRSPSTPNSVFRLMGKNLMVVNKEEDCVPKIGHLPVELSMTNESQKSHSSVCENAQHFDHQSRSALFDMTSGRKGFVSSMDCHRYENRHFVEKPHNTLFVPLLRNPHSDIMVMNDPSDFRRTCDSGNMHHVGPVYYEPRHAGPMRPRYNPLYSGPSQIGRHVNSYNVPPGNGMNNVNQVSWSRAGEGRVVSTGHERSSFYFTTGVCLPTKFA